MPRVAWSLDRADDRGSIRYDSGLKQLLLSLGSVHGRFKLSARGCICAEWKSAWACTSRSASGLDCVRWRTWGGLSGVLSRCSFFCFASRCRIRLVMHVSGPRPCFCHADYLPKDFLPRACTELAHNPGALRDRPGGFNQLRAALAGGQIETARGRLHHLRPICS